MPRELHIVVKVDPALLSLLTRLLIQADDKEALTKLTADVRERTSALDAAVKAIPPTTPT